MIHYFLREVHYLRPDEDTARQITSVFKKRVVAEETVEQPAELLLDIARNEFELPRLGIPPMHQDRVMQNFAGPAKTMVGSRSTEARRIKAV